MLNKEVEKIQKQFGKLIPKEIVEEGVNIAGTFANEEKGIDKKSTISLDIFKEKKTAKEFIGKKVGDVVELNTKGLFDDDHKLMDYLKVAHDEVHGLDIDVTLQLKKLM